MGTKKLAKEAKQLIVSILRDAKVIELKNMIRGKYFRIIADVCVCVDDKNLAEILLDSDLAVRYYGCKISVDWCR